MLWLFLHTLLCIKMRAACNVLIIDISVAYLQNQAVAQAQDSSQENLVTYDYALPVNQDLLISDCRNPLNPHASRYLSYGRDPSVCDPYSSDIRRPTDSLIPKV